MLPFAARSRSTALLAALAAAGACADVAGAPVDVTESRRVHLLQGFDSPESVRYDPEQDVYFVSSMIGVGSARDGQAYISRIAAGHPSRVETFVQGGRGGAVLNAPKGMAIQGDTLWVADIDALRGFHRRTGAPVATIEVPGAVMLNDIAVGPDGALYVTDTGIEMTPIGVFYRGGERILEVASGRRLRVVTQGPALKRPNGITFDPVNRRWLVVSFDPFESPLYTVQPDGAPTVLASGPGRFDGVERLADGRILATAWNDSSVHLIDGTSDRRLIRGLWQPADLGVDTRRGRVAIPLVLQGRVEIWTIPPK